jgi:NAD(P)-dependent dehydrogenase (short-subunit alcohol dehydrogenase family)
MSDFEGKVGLVTGAASGIGESIALLYAKHGARVVVSDVNDTDGQETMDAINSAGGEARYVHAEIGRGSGLGLRTPGLCLQ